ncbi:MAG: antirepressor regulating drug resistance protein, partial [Clostridia bacterium]|nr:antirepressor regulating drug resistance protein [Clostridia bacterium]
DIELACDERVIRGIGSEEKMAYSEALLDCTIKRSSIAACPLAFGEVGVKQRVKNILNYKKPAFWVLIAAILSCIAVAVCFMTGPKNNGDKLLGATYRVQDIMYEAPIYSFAYTIETAPEYCISADYALYERVNVNDNENTDWNYKGGLTPYSVDKEKFARLFIDYSENFSALAIAERVSSAYKTTIDGDNNRTFYMVLQLDNGDMLLAIGYERENENEINNHVRWLFKLETTSEAGVVDIDYIEKSIAAEMGYKEPIYSFAIEKFDDYMVVGFIANGIESDSGLEKNKSDIGCDLFRYEKGKYINEYSTRFKGRAIEQDRISVTSITMQNNKETAAYDVILSNNENLAEIRRSIGNTTNIKSEDNLSMDIISVDIVPVTENIPGMPTMTLIKCPDTEYNAANFSFYDKDGKQIDRYTEPVVTGITISTLPENTEYLRTYTSPEKINAILAHIIDLTLNDKFNENPEEYYGMTYVITITYNNNGQKIYYHFGNMFFKEDGKAWEKMIYDEAVKLENIIQKNLSD